MTVMSLQSIVLPSLHSLGRSYSLTGRSFARCAHSRGWVGARHWSRCRWVVRKGTQQRAGMAVAGMLGEAVKAVWREVCAAQGPSQRVLVAFSLAITVLREVGGMLTLLPYGIYAKYLYESFEPFHSSYSSSTESQMAPGQLKPSGILNGASMHGSRRLQIWSSSLSNRVLIARNVRYGNAERNLADVYVPKTQVRASAMPVVMYVHGGVWSSGERWQYCPLAAHLAQHGVVVVVVQYSLYPQVLAKIQVSEVSLAMTWTMDNAGYYGGDPSKVYVMGHSSGGHIGAMMLWERANRRLNEVRDPVLQELDVRQPYCFIGLSGVYDIKEHYKFEVSRGVGAISCMRPAMGGERGFESMSPTLLFSSLSAQGTDFSGVVEHTADNSAKMQVKGTDLVPTCMLFASRRDTVVPPASSCAFHSVLKQLGCDSRVILHDDLRHHEFVLWCNGWGQLRPHVGPFLKDLVGLITYDTSQTSCTSCEHPDPSVLECSTR